MIINFVPVKKSYSGSFFNGLKFQYIVLEAVYLYLPQLVLACPILLVVGGKQGKN